LLPHRYPFVLVDRVLALAAGERIQALKNVTINEPFFQGHFPGTPIMPGVLILEALAQAGGLLVAASRPIAADEVVYFSAMDRVRFRRPVVPGDQLVLEARLIKLRQRAAKISAEASVDGRLAAEAELMANFGEQP